MQRRNVPRTDPRYNQIRARNNDSVKRSREKSRRERDEITEAIDQLEDENQLLRTQIEKLKHEYDQLQELFQQHTGISMDQLMSSDVPSTSTSTFSTAPKPVQPPNDNPPQPVLSITANDEKTSTTTSDTQLDPSTLDGAVVLINGVQYKIVSMNKS
jgi:DNA-binding protein H-NS